MIIKHLQDSELGEILFRRNNRAKRYIIRYGRKGISVTIPCLGSLKEAERFFLKNRSKLATLREKIDKQTRCEYPDIGTQELLLLKEKAVAYLPEELARLAKAYGLHYQSCKIGKSRTHWGSCSISGTIRLSLFLMLLPENLIQYVLLHELCHTVHHNHGEDFWALLDKCTEGKAKQLRKELKKHFIPR